jgi:hypothetical protein
MWKSFGTPDTHPHLREDTLLFSLIDGGIVVVATGKSRCKRNL